MKKKTAMRIVCAVLCMVMLFLTGCTAAKTEQQATATEGAEQYKDTVVLFGVPSTMVSFDFEGTDAAKVQLMTHSRMVEKNLAEGKPAEVIAGLATEWEWLDDTTLEMKLREGVKFHNGEPFEADDVLFTFNECLLTHSQAAKLSMLDHVEAVDENTVRFILKQFHNDFLFMLTESICSIVNREAVEENEVEGAYIGTGAYKLTEFVQSDYVDLERFDDYWGETPKTHRFHLRNIPESSTALMALENGEVDATDFDVVDMPYVENNDALTYRINPFSTLYFAFNTSKGPGTDENLRLAVAYAINPEDYLMLMDPGYSQPLYTMWGPETCYGYDASIPAYGHDLEKAKDYLAKSKYKEFTITLNSALVGVAEVLQAQCKEIGLTVNINGVDGAAVGAMTKFNSNEHEAIIFTFNMNLHGDDCRRLYYPNSNVNKAILTDEQIIELVDKAAMEKDDAARTEMYHEIQRINHEKAYYLPLCLVVESLAYNKNLQNIHFDPRGRHDWSYCYVTE